MFAEFEQPPMKSKVMVNLAKDYKKTIAKPTIKSMRIISELDFNIRILLLSQMNFVVYTFAIFR